MKRGSVRKQLSRFACAIEIWDEMQSIVGILIYVDIPENITKCDGEFILQKYDKEKKYVVRAIRRKESKALLFAQVQEFKDYTKGTTVPDWESKSSADTITVYNGSSDKSEVEESNHRTASCCINL